MHTSIQWQCTAFKQLKPHQIYAIFALRSEVFVVEQNCVYQDFDGADLEALHLMAWAEDGKTLAAYARILAPDVKFAEASIGRVISHPKFRGTGIGRQLLTHSIAHVQAHYPQQAIRISAQAYLQKFYESFGFVPVSPEYLEDDIVHLEMLRN